MNQNNIQGKPPCVMYRVMAKIDEIKTQLGDDYEMKLDAQIRVLAQNMVQLDNLNELCLSFVSPTYERTDQKGNTYPEMRPEFEAARKLSQTVTDQLAKLMLNRRDAAGKEDPTKKNKGKSALDTFLDKMNS